MNKTFAKKLAIDSKKQKHSDLDSFRTFSYFKKKEILWNVHIQFLFSPLQTMKNCRRYVKIQLININYMARIKLKKGFLDA